MIYYYTKTLVMLIFMLLFTMRVMADSCDPNDADCQLKQKQMQAIEESGIKPFKKDIPPDLSSIKNNMTVQQKKPLMTQSQPEPFPIPMPLSYQYSNQPPKTVTTSNAYLPQTQIDKPAENINQELALPTNQQPPQSSGMFYR